MTGFGQIDLLGLFIHPVIARPFLFLLAGQARHDLVDLAIEFRAFLSRPGDDQRGARLINQDRVHFVHQRVMQGPLHFLIQAEGHVVAQVVEAVFVVGAVGDVGAIGGAFFLGTHAGDDHPDAHPEKLINLAHPVGVAPGQIVVDRHHVDALAGQRVEVDRQRRHQGLALAGAHFGDLAFVQHHAADQLHVEMAHVQRALAGLAHHREGLRQQRIQRLALRQAVFEFIGLGAQVGVAQGGDARFQGVDPVRDLAHPADHAVIAAAKNGFQNVHQFSRERLRHSGRGKGIDNGQSLANNLAVLQVFGVESRTIRI